MTDEQRADLAGDTGTATHEFEFKDHPRYADLCAHRSGHTGWLYCGLPKSAPIHSGPDKRSR